MTALLAILGQIFRPILEVLANAFFKTITEPDTITVAPDPTPVLESVHVDPVYDDNNLDRFAGLLSS